MFISIPSLTKIINYKKVHHEFPIQNVVECVPKIR